MKNLNVWLGLAAGAATWMLSTAVAGSGDSPAARATPASSQLVPLPGHVHGLAQARFDVGEAPAALPMGGLELVLAQSPQQKQALEQLLAAQQDPESPQYHHWLTPSQFGARFGASEATVTALSQWLEANGFKVDPLPASRSRLSFHGTKAQVEAAFHTRIHLFEVGGEKHFANLTDPEVPAALATLITVIQGLHDFYPKSTASARHAAPAIAGAQPQINYGSSTNNLVGPGDFAVIYNLQPLYAAGANGGGVTIAIAGQSDVSPTVTSAYWTGFTLATPQFSSIPVPTGQDPGQTNDGNELEAYIDVEIAGSLAQGANILLVRDKNAFNAVQYVIEQNLAAILNISFSSCESHIGAANSALSSLFQQAASEGITVTVSSGDSGVAECATAFTQGTLSTSGFAVNGIASTPYVLAVGGTDFDPTQPQEWATGIAPATLVSALAHIPEMVWNDTCANPLWAKALGYASTNTLCNTATLNGQPNPLLEVGGGAGGLSSCLSITNGVCTGGYPQPAWQTGVAGIRSPSTRAVPDVSMLASNWVICSYDNTPCDPANQNIDVIRGTSAAAPAVAAIIAILNQEMSSASSPDGRQGLINSQLYRLAAVEYGSPQAPNTAAAACSASLGSSIGTGCVFYNVIAGSNATPCQVSGYIATGSLPASICAVSTGQANGIMELGSSAGYLAGPGFNLATGLGSINAGNLVRAVYLPPPSGLVGSATGQSINLTWTAEPHATSYNIYEGTQSGREGSTPVQSGVTATSATFTGLQYGQTYFFTLNAESVLGASGQSDEAQVTIVPTPPPSLSAAAGNGAVTLTWTAATGANTYNIYQGSSSGGESAQPVQTGRTGLTATVTGLTNGTTYYFKVAGVDAGGASALSPEAQAAPVAPSGGGTLDLLDLVMLAALLARRYPASPQRRRGCVV
jgi:subtilase family serine protease